MRYCGITQASGLYPRLSSDANAFVLTWVFCEILKGGMPPLYKTELSHLFSSDATHWYAINGRVLHETDVTIWADSLLVTDRFLERLPSRVAEQFELLPPESVYLYDLSLHDLLRLERSSRKRNYRRRILTTRDLPPWEAPADSSASGNVWRLGQLDTEGHPTRRATLQCSWGEKPVPRDYRVPLDLVDQHGIVGYHAVWVRDDIAEIVIPFLQPMQDFIYYQFFEITPH